MKRFHKDENTNTENKTNGTLNGSISDVSFEQLQAQQLQQQQPQTEQQKYIN